MDLTDTIVPRSDQLNAEDLLTGPRTFTVSDVRKGSAEQPVDIHLVEFPGRPFKPSKTVRRILVSAWGPDAAAYPGRRMTLYRDPAVRFGGMDVGGIRVSHLSHIGKPLTLVLAVSKGKRAPYVVQPLKDEPATTPTPNIDAELKDIHAGMTRLGIKDRDAALASISQVIDREVKSPTDLTRAEASTVLDWIKHEESQPEPTLDGVQ
jgi:hypothetical protein